MTRAAGALVMLCLMGGCEPADLPPPVIVSVMPERIAEGGPSMLTVEVSGQLPLSVDYESESAVVSPITLVIAGEETEAIFTQQEGKLVTTAPLGLARGAYDVQLALADGREAMFPGAFSVVSPEELQPEDTVVRGDLTGFQIDPIGEQVVGVPFKVSIRALGPGASSFQGTGTLRASKSKEAPITTAAFSGGALQQEFSVDKPGPKIVLTFEDAMGNMGVSNPFRVRPK